MAVTPSLASALEIRNLHSGQAGKRAYIQYDLSGRPGEKEADITISIEIAGEQYGPGKLSLSGDLGKNVKVGIGKRIWWDLLKDMPAGYDGEISWNLEVSETAEHLASLKAQKELANKEQQERAKALQLEAERQRKVEENRKIAEQVALKTEQPAKPVVAYKKTNASATTETGPLTSQKDVVLDSSSGLMWAKLGDDTTEKFTYDRALGYIAKINREKFGGFRDWRLPERDEATQLFATVNSIAASTKSKPYKVLLKNFPNLENWNYWLKTDGMVTGVGPLGYLTSWHVDIETGIIGYSKKMDSLCILPVRSNNLDNATGTPSSPSTGKEPTHSGDQKHQPEQAKAENATGFKELGETVLDTSNGLMWASLKEGAAEKLDYDRAIGFVNQTNKKRFAGFSDWRLPSRDEAANLYKTAHTLATRTKKEPFMVLKHYLPSLENWNYWLKTDGPTKQGILYAWYIDVERGTMDISRKTDGLCILLVRTVSE